MLAPGEAQLLNLSVVPDARREGLGRELLAQFVADSRRLGAEQMFLEVRIGNAPAIALYEAAGFVRIARRVAYYPPTPGTGVREDALVMRRPLQRPVGPDLC
jgi:ribosomal-protein-alanine N-acetyltransferase